MTAEQLGVLAGQIVVILGGTHWGQRVLYGRLSDQIRAFSDRIGAAEAEIRRSHDRIDTVYALMGISDHAKTEQK